MHTMKNRSTKICFVWATLLSTLLSCKTSSEGALFESDEDFSFKQGNTVSITPARDQGKANFCWAYGATALIEGLHKSRTGKELILSPEFLGIHHLARKLKAKFERTGKVEDLDKLTDNLFSGKVETSSVRDRDEQMGLSTILESYGIVPEAVYSVKFIPSAAEPEPSLIYQVGLIDRMYEVFEKRGVDSFKRMSEKDIIAEIIVAPQGPGYTAAPPESFQFEGKTYTPRSFLKEVLRFDPRAMVLKIAKRGYWSESNIEAVETAALIAEIDANIKAGIPVPFAINYDPSKLVRGAFLEDAPVAAVKGSAFGHMMTIVGPIANPVRAAHSQDRFIVKNSWGASVDPNDAIPRDGLYLMDVGYVKSNDEFFMAYLPKVVGKKPFLSDEASRRILRCAGHSSCGRDGWGFLRADERECKRNTADWNGDGCKCKCSLN